jgi:hypothetical protein
METMKSETSDISYQAEYHSKWNKKLALQSAQAASENLTPRLQRM